MTGAENLRMMADLRNLRAESRRATDLWERVDTKDVARKQVTTCSGGMKRKLDPAMTWIGRAERECPRRAHRGRESGEPPRR